MPNETLVTLSDLTASLQEIGLTIREDKCKLYFPMASEDFSTDIYMSKDGINVLGAPIGTPDYVKLAHWPVLHTGRLDYSRSEMYTGQQKLEQFLVRNGQFNLVAIPSTLPENSKFACEWRWVLLRYFKKYTQHVSNVRTEQSELYSSALDII